MPIEILKTASTELEEAFELLIPQLSKSSTPMKIDSLTRLLGQECLDLLVFRSESGESEGKIVGMLALVTFEIPTGVRAWIEDVVVDASARGQGAGQRLVEEAVRVANEKGAKSIDLTSRPTREAANRLYRRAGFEARETNVYRFKSA